MLHLDKLAKIKKKSEMLVNKHYANQFEKNQGALKEIHNKKRMLAELNLMKDKKEQKAVLKKARESDAFFEASEIERTSINNEINNASTLEELESIVEKFKQKTAIGETENGRTENRL